MNNEIKSKGNDFEVVQATPDHMRVMDAMAEALKRIANTLEAYMRDAGDEYDPTLEEAQQALAEYAKIKQTF